MSLFNQQNDRLVSFDESLRFIVPSWDRLNHLAFVIAQQIHKQGLVFDRLVALAKGGWSLTRSLVDFLQVAQVASIGVRFYAGMNTRLAQPEIYQDLPISVVGESVLLFDDVADTGESLQFVVEYLTKQGVAECRTASLYLKPWSKKVPDFYGAKTDAWIIFPYDAVETIKTLTLKWRKQGLDDDQIKYRLLSLAIDPQVVHYYFNQV